ncbi:MAG: hypothetical protein IT376_13170 [Polyangiaceae bacterium]|nr:hypothetical protein [Polyangiaceae bacterium]
MVSTLGFAWLLGPACSSSGTEPAPAIERSLCAAVRCSPPPCCGGRCVTSSDCCAATTCSPEGRCVPQSCAVCGDAKCVVDDATCTAQCAAGDCCTATCVTDLDCCDGARCGSVGGEPRCVPLECASCGGMRPVCRFDRECRVLCEAPASCGDDCTTDADCDERSVCSARAGTRARCAPKDFEALCSACPAGCLLDARTCEVVCTEPGGSCRACCEACDASHPCCPGSRCDALAPGGPACVPDACSACAYGCAYACPR